MAGVGDDASPLWPMTKMRQAIASRASAGLRPPKLGYAAILSTGGMNPVHRGHVQLLLQAAKRLETIGYSVVGLWLSPSHDGYLQPKARGLGTIGLSAPFRLEVAQRAVAPEDLVDAAGWEVNYPGRWPDFPEVSEALQDELARQPEANELWPGKRPCVFYACGTDHAEKCGLTRGLRPSDGIGVVIVPRAGDSVPAERPDKLVRVASPASDAVAALSSTRVREAVEKKDLEYLSQALPPGAVEFLLRPSLEEHQRFPRDFELLGLDTTATSSPPRRRRIYISLSALLCGWDQEGEKLLEELPEAKLSWLSPQSRITSMLTQSTSPSGNSSSQRRGAARCFSSNPPTSSTTEHSSMGTLLRSTGPQSGFSSVGILSRTAFTLRCCLILRGGRPSSTDRRASSRKTSVLSSRTSKMALTIMLR